MSAMPKPGFPLPLGSLEPALRPLGRARGLPAEAFLGGAVLEWELAHLFEGGWTTGGRAAEVAEPGSRMAVEAGREPVLLLRGRDGGLRALSDVCRHRGHLLAEPG